MKVFTIARPLRQELEPSANRLLLVLLAAGLLALLAMSGLCYLVLQAIAL